MISEGGGWKGKREVGQMLRSGFRGERCIEIEAKCQKQEEDETIRDTHRQGDDN